MSHNPKLQKLRIERLEQQLKAVNAELTRVTTSRGYKVVRALGNAKSEARRSPRSFVRKVARKVLSKAPGRTIKNLSINLAAQSDMASQYRQWISFNEPDEMELASQRVGSDKFTRTPLISIVTPVFNPPTQVFRDLVESVLAQTYPNFELCLGDFGDSAEIQEIIVEYASKDTRVKNLKFSENKGIAANSNQILKHVKGEYIALLDHDDTFSPDALYENVRLINRTDPDFIFSDKDKIDIEGNRFEPFFKPGWSPDMMLSVNYLTHLNVMRTSVVKQVGGWSSETDGAQDWDLFLKIISVTSKIEHLPRVLYHWRIISTSTSLSIETKPYALKGQRVAVDKYLKEWRIPATTYHQGAELLLDWQKSTLITHMVVLTESSGQAQAFISEAADFFARAEGALSCTIIGPVAIKTPGNIDMRLSKGGDYLRVLADVCNQTKADNIFVVSDLISLAGLDVKDFSNLAGWLEVPGVSAVYPRLVGSDGETALDCGAVISDGEIRPIFANCPPYYQSPTGNIEWIKNVSVGSPLFIGTKRSELSSALSSIKTWVGGGSLPAHLIVGAYLFGYKNGNRTVLNPKVKIGLVRAANYNIENTYTSASIIFRNELPYSEYYYNPNIDPIDPMAIIGIRQQDMPETAADSADISDYSIEAFVHAQNLLVSEQDISANLEHIENTHSVDITIARPSFLFILPGFTGIYAGLNNVFSYAQTVRGFGHKVAFALLVQENEVARHAELVTAKFPALRKAEFFPLKTRDAADLPVYDIAICTQWATAYALVNYNKCLRKCYFIQDKEASFYPSGTISALVQNTYRFGFFALANTPGLLDWYSNAYGGQGTTLRSNIDLTVYGPPPRLNLQPDVPYKVFFYGRPNEPRNAFELGASALRILKAKYGGDIQIYAAGAQWAPVDYGLEDVLTNLGKISYEELPTFYRSLDAGLMFMFSGHPGVVASELMASGCPVVVNKYDDATWNELYKTEVNCLTSLPTAEAVAQDLQRILTNPELRARIIPAAITTVNGFYGGYQKASLEVTKLLLKGFARPGITKTKPERIVGHV